MGMVGQHHTLADLHPGETHYPLYRRLGGPQSRSGQVRKISPPPGFDPQIMQPVASRYTDWATPAHQTVTIMVLKHGGAHVSSTPFQLCPPRMWHNAVQYAGTSVWRNMLSPLSTAPWKWRQQVPQDHLYIYTYLPDNTASHPIRL